MMDPAERTSSTLSGGAPHVVERRPSGLQSARKRGLGVDAEITSERDVYFDTEVVRGEVTLIAEREVCVRDFFLSLHASGKQGEGGGVSWLKR
jgi:hypothetical protein